MLPEKKQYIYVLRPIERLRKEENWTKKEEDIVSDHFNALVRLKEEGTLILAGKTNGLDDSTFGIVIFEAATDEEALAIMNGDPAVAKGVMTAELYPYRVAIAR